jgi:hypothetical protein
MIPASNSTIAHLAMVALFAIATACGATADDERPLESAYESGKSDAVVDASARWPDGDIYVVIASEADDSFRKTLEDLARELEANTPVRVWFVEHGSETPNFQWVSYYQNPETAGGQAVAGTVFNLFRHAAQTSIWALPHEFGHTIGMFHTQQRVDRDDHIVYHRKYVPLSTHFSAFARQGSVIGPYDLKSVMHYGSFDFSHLNPQYCATMSLRDPSSTSPPDPDECLTGSTIENRRIYERLTYSQWDYAVIAAMYCERDYCRWNCASEARCQAPTVKAHLARLNQWRQSSEGRAAIKKWGPM